MFEKGRTTLVLLLLMVIAASVMITGCKKSDDNPIIIVQPDVGGTLYWASSMYGDLLSYQLNTATPAYSYRKIEGPSPIGVGKGDLVLQGGLGAYAYKDADPGDDTMHAALPGKLAVVGGDDFIAAGVPQITSSYNIASIEGMYNIIFYQYDFDSDENSGWYGTLDIVNDGTFKVWMEIDGTTYPASNFDQGTWTDNGDGRVYIYADSMLGKFGTAAFYPSANGTIFVMNMPKVRGMLIGLPQASVSPGDFNGTYDIIDASAIVYSVGVVSGTDITVAPDPAVTLTFDYPWTGFMNNGGVYVIASQDGFFAGIEQVTGDDDNGFIGIKE